MTKKRKPPPPAITVVVPPTPEAPRLRVLRFSPQAEKDVEALPLDVQVEVRNAARQIRAYPNTSAVSGFKALTGPLRGLYSSRATRSYRLVFVLTPGGEFGFVDVIAVGDRKDIYTIAARRRPSAQRDPSRTMAFERRSFATFRLSGEVQIGLIIARTLTRARRTARLSVDELARRLRFPEDAVRLIEAGQYAPSRAYVRAVVKACGLPSYWPAKRP